MSMDGPFSAAEDATGRAPSVSVNATNGWMDRRPDGGIAAASGAATRHRVGAGRCDPLSSLVFAKPPRRRGSGSGERGNSWGWAWGRVFLLVSRRSVCRRWPGRREGRPRAGTVAETNGSGSAAPTSRGSARGTAGVGAIARLDPAMSDRPYGEEGRRRRRRGRIFDPRRLPPLGVERTRPGGEDGSRGGGGGTGREAAPDRPSRPAASAGPSIDETAPSSPRRDRRRTGPFPRAGAEDAPDRDWSSCVPVVAARFPPGIGSGDRTAAPAAVR